MQQSFLSQIATVTVTPARRKKKYENESDSDNFKEGESDAFEEERDSFEEDYDPENSEENESADDRDANVPKKLHETWCRLSLPINETEIVGKWFAEVYETKRSKRLWIDHLK